MAYIGVSPSNGVRRVHTYTATASQTTFTGASSEGVTLSYADTNYIDVFQNGVLLGSDDYTATSGTSVVLSQSASSSDLIVIIVYDVFSVADTVSKTNGGSFDSAVTFSNDVTIGDASASDKKILFNGNAQDFHIGLDDSADSLTIGLGSALGTTSHMVIDSTGAVTKPLQPSFFATGATNDWNDNIAVGTNIVLDHTKHNQGSHYSTSTGKFTAPINGVYSFQFGAYVKNASGTALMTARLNDANINYNNSAYPAVQCFTQDADTNDEVITMSWTYYMTASQTMSVASGDAGTDYFESMTWFSGFLVG